MRDLTGQKFGKLTAINFIRMDKAHRAVWLFKCDCGKTKETQSHRVTTGNTQSCGCILAENEYVTIAKDAFRKHKSSAKRRKYDWFLNFEEYYEIAKKPCVYCGKTSMRKNFNTGARLKLNSVDRINNEPYYRVSNCQSVCFMHQRMKSNFTHDEFVKSCIDVSNFLRKDRK